MTHVQGMQRRLGDDLCFAYPTSRPQEKSILMPGSPPKLLWLPMLKVSFGRCTAIYSGAKGRWNKSTWKVTRPN